MIYLTGCLDMCLSLGYVLVHSKACSGSDAIVDVTNVVSQFKHSGSLSYQ